MHQPRPLNPATNERQLMLAAIERHAMGQFPEAESLYAQVIRLNRKNHEALQRWAMAKQAQGQHRDALQLLDKALHMLPNAPLAHCNRGYILQDLGRRKEAIASFERAIRLKPDLVAAYSGLGTLYAELNEVEKACAAFDRAARLDPRSVEPVVNKGVLFEKHDRPDEAIAAFDAALRLAPGDPMILLHKVFCLRQKKDFAAALRICDAVLATRPDAAPMHFERGLVLSDSGHHFEAIAAFVEAGRLNHELASCHYNIGHCMRELRRFEEAHTAYQQTIALGQNDAEVFNCLAAVRRELFQPEEALAAVQQALAIDPKDKDALLCGAELLVELDRTEAAFATYDRAKQAYPNSPDVYCSLGLAASTLRQYDDAISHYTKALSLDRAHVYTLNNYAVTLQKMGQHEAALARFEQAMALKPDYAEAHVNAGMCRLEIGDYAAGWKLHEHRYQSMRLPTPAAPKLPPRWQGNPDIAGKTILLWAEQGYGDVLQFARYAPLVAALGARVVLEVHPPLVVLCATLAGVSQVVAAGDALPDLELGSPLMSLPFLFHTTVETIPADIPYLHVPTDYAARWRGHLGPRRRPRVGLAWRGRQNLRKRSIPLLSLEPLLRVPGIDWHVVQKEMVPADRAWIAETGLLRSHDEHLHDFADTAALVAEMDLVITIDTSAAHLAGALGIPTWIMLRQDADWRWLLDRDDSPWYPTARLFRQTIPDDWTEVIAQVQAALETHPLPLREGEGGRGSASTTLGSNAGTDPDPSRCPPPSRGGGDL